MTFSVPLGGQPTGPGPIHVPPDPRTARPETSGPIETRLPVHQNVVLTGSDGPGPNKPVTLEEVPDAKWDNPKKDPVHKDGEILRLKEPLKDANGKDTKDPTWKVALHLLHDRGLIDNKDNIDNVQFLDFKAVLPGETMPGSTPPRGGDTVELDTFTRTIKGKQERCYMAMVTFQVTVADPTTGKPKTIEFQQRIETTVKAPLAVDQRAQAESMLLAKMAIMAYTEKLSKPVQHGDNGKIQELAGKKIFKFILERTDRADGWYGHNAKRFTHVKGSSAGSVYGVWLTRPFGPRREMMSVSNAWGSKITCKLHTQRDQLMHNLQNHAKQRLPGAEPPPTRDEIADDVRLFTEVEGARTDLSRSEKFQLFLMFQELLNIKDSEGQLTGLSVSNVLNMLTRNTDIDRIDLNSVLAKAGEPASERLNTSPLAHLGDNVETIQEDILAFKEYSEKIGRLTQEIKDLNVPERKPDTMTDAKFNELKTKAATLTKDRDMAFAWAEKHKERAKEAMQVLEDKYQNIKANPTAIRTLMSIAPQKVGHPLDSVFKTLQKSLIKLEGDVQHQKIDERMQKTREEFSSLFTPLETNYNALEGKPSPDKMPIPKRPEAEESKSVQPLPNLNPPPQPISNTGIPSVDTRLLDSPGFAQQGGSFGTVGGYSGGNPI